MTHRRKSYKYSLMWLLRERGNICEYCLKVMKRNELSVDHATPLSRGGYNKRTNYIICCKTCNSEKGSMTKEEYLSFRRKRDRKNFLDNTEADQ